ncbi:hypothetical protein [Tsukamurella tyrosinosolvens]|uniref:hypothetical protein n=1 Tax=Tsukamurella tyrosinosolvens TaxID=57704 RepID=UPI000C7EBA16|nr:hypothetical protein [Tsukamurella tyrosinosolvens]AUN38822.1 hypothetical protein ASU32_01385 [Tsukamurella tyrosinosolvens]
MAIELELLAPPREPMSLVDGLAVAVPSGRPSCTYAPGDPTALAEFLVHGVHDEGPGFEIAVADADEAVAVLCATVAALTGDDIPAALAAPDEARLAALNPMAQDTVRERLRHVVTPDPQALTDRLHALGLK